jgi:CP family cyanate transporter-like MFS transporter
VLLPGLIKRDFPRHIEIMTATYATTLGVTAAISSGVAVPIASVAPGGWRTALGCWALIALAGALVWLPRLGVTTRPPRVAGSPGLWRSALAWQVTAFIGLQSFGFYVVVTWLPTILQTHHYSSSAAGWQLFLYQAVSLVASSGAPVMAQSMGYLFAAAGPVALGVLHDVWHSWTTPLVVLIGVARFQVAAGFAAGRARTLAR